MNSTIQKTIFFLLLLASLTPWISAPIALVFGIVFALLIGNPYEKQAAKAVKKSLKIAIIGLGFGMNFYSAINAGKDGILLTITTIILVLTLGFFVGRLLKMSRKTSCLVSSGTAICGGSAIAAVAPVLKSSEEETSVALATIFVLNAIALFVFPIIGHALELTQHEFGLWSAVAIHDTSSVVGAASQYGEEALEVATTVKLGRALWIIPLALFISIIHRNKESKIKIPYFILLFIAAMLISTFVPQLSSVYEWIAYLSKRLLVATLFLIGTGISLKTIQTVGFKSLGLGIILWITVSIVSLTIILS